MESSHMMNKTETEGYIQLGGAGGALTRRGFLGAAAAAAAATGLGVAGCSGAGESGGSSAGSLSDTTVTVEGETTTVSPNYVGTLVPSFTSRSGDSYTLGLYVIGDTIDTESSCMADYGVIEDDVSSGVSLSNLKIDAVGTGFSVVAVGGSGSDDTSLVSILDTDITLTDGDDEAADGTNASDFTGLGAAVVTSGVAEDAHNMVSIDNSTIQTTGFERDGIVISDYSDVVVTNSTITVNGANPLPGGDAYNGYLSSANQAYMISPPWVLGITGGARAANLLESGGSLTVADSTVEAGAWAVLSTDDCTSPVINVVNSKLCIAHADSDYGLPGGADVLGYGTNYGTGYGTYAIGGAAENFYGATFSDVTYATIMTGSGELYYGPSRDGLVLKNASGEAVLTYSGEAQDTQVTGVWGLMDHQGGSATLDEGSTWTTEEATILKKGSSSSTYTLQGATISPASGLIFQLMDNDDGYGTSSTGGDTTAQTYDGSTWGSPVFSGGWAEPAGEAGLPSALGNLSDGGSVSSTVNITSGSYQGDLFNASGSGSGQDATGLKVSLGDGVILTGRVSSAEAVHAIPYSSGSVKALDELAAGYGDGVAFQGGSDGPRNDGTYTVSYALLDEAGEVSESEKNAAWIQLLEFTMKEYYLLGHVANWPCAGATCEVVVDEGATWNVTGDCYLSYLSVGSGALVSVASGATLFVGEEELSDIVAAGEYGTASTADSDHAAEEGSGGAGAGSGSGGPGAGAGSGGAGAGSGDGGATPPEMPSGSAAPSGVSDSQDTSSDQKSASSETSTSTATLDTTHTVRLTVSAK